MKKAVVKISVFALIASVLLVVFFPLQNLKIAKANSTISARQTLLSTDISIQDFINSGGDVNELSTFTPFDELAGGRMPGKSISPAADKNNSFIGAKYKLSDNNGGLNINQEDLSFGIWVYFGDTSVHSLEIKVMVDEQNYFKINLSKTDLLNILKKTEGMTEQAFAWNYIEIPIFNSYITGNISDSGGNLKTFTFLELTYTSSEIDESSTFANFKFYGLDLITRTSSLVKAHIKQDYTLKEFNFWAEDIQNSIIKGDIVSLPSFADAISYAWVGDIDLLAGGISWLVYVTTPSKTTTTYNFGESIEFTEQGEYTITYRAKKQTDNITIDVYEGIEIEVKSNELIYFEFNSYKMGIGESYIISLKNNAILNMQTANVTLISSNNNEVATIEATNNIGEYIVRGLKEGTTDVVVKIVVNRNTNNSEPAEYTASATIEITPAKQSNTTLRIIILSILGVILLVGLIFGIKSVVQSRKNDVK